MWTYRGKPFEESLTEGYVGFVYIITSLSGKKYVGKKLFRFRRTKKVRGKKVKVTIDSDWKNYYGSSAALLKDLDVQGKESFTREILHLCKSKGTASYLEMKEQILREVLESDQYYNDQIRARVHRSHIKL